MAEDDGTLPRLVDHNGAVLRIGDPDRSRLAWAKLCDYQCDAVEGAYGAEDKSPWATKIRNAVESFERCAALCPRSTLADDALRAAAYWRQERSRAFE